MDNNKETKSSIKDIVKFLTKGIVFCVILAFIMYIISPIFSPKWYNNMHGGATRRVKGIYTEPKDTIDIVGIGSSDLYASGVSTMKLWNDMGTTTYYIGISKQTTWTAYYMLKDFYKRQSPKLAIINMDFCFETGDGYKKYIREGTDNMPMSINKLEMINDPVFNNSLKDKISFVFPVIRFHSRWSELTKEELKQAYTNDNVPFKGYELNKKIDPYKKPKKGQGLKDKNKQQFESIPDNASEYLDKILELCKQNNTEVLLIYVPTIRAWNQSKHEACVKYAEERNLTFIDYNSSDFDWKKNTRDNGYHLNMYGADIVTQKLEETIKQYNLPNHKEDSNYQHWNESYQIYEELIKSKK